MLEGFTCEEQAGTLDQRSQREKGEGRGGKWSEGRKKTGGRREIGTDSVTRKDHALLSSFRSSMSEITGLQFTSPFPDHQIKLRVSKPVEEKWKEYQDQGGKCQREGAIGLRISLPEKRERYRSWPKFYSVIRTLARDSGNFTS